MEEYVIPKERAFYIASSFYRNAMWEATFEQHFNSAFDTFNLICRNYKEMKAEVIKLLKLKLREYENTNNVTFGKMIKMFIDFRKDKVKENKLYGYNNKLTYLKSLYKIKLKDFNYLIFER